MHKQEIDYINGPTTKNIYGMKRYQDEIHKNLPGIKLNRIEYETPGFAPLRWMWKLFFPIMAFFSCKKGRVKHITTQFMSYLLLLPQFREKTIVTVYDTIFLERLADFPLHTQFFIRLNVEGMKKADRIVTISDYSAEQIMKLMGASRNRITVIKPGIDHLKFKPGKRRKADGGPVILCLGSEEPRQNIDKVVEAVSLLKKKYPSIMLLKAGKPQWKGGREHLIELIKRIDLQENVKFLDYVQEKELPSLYRSCDLMIYPPSSVGWGLPPSEAMACGTPVIVSDHGSLPEVVGNTQVKLKSLSAKSIAREIDSVYSDKKLMAKMGRAGIARVKIFSWKKAADIMRSLYSTIANE